MAAYDVTTAAASLNFTTENVYNSCAQVDENHFLNVWGGIDNDGFTQVFTVNTTTWAVSTAAASLEFDPNSTVQYNAVIKVDTNHFLNFWFTTAGSASFAQVFTVNTTTWAVTTAAASLGSNCCGSYNSVAQIDENHFINFFQINDLSSDGAAQVFTVNTTTWAVTTAAALLEFDTQNCTYNSCFQIDTNHFINFWLGGAATTDGFVQVFTVNTTTWAVTTAASSLLFDTDVGSHNKCYQVDENHFINFWQGAAGDGFVQVFTVNTTTWAVTTAAAQLEFDTQQDLWNSVAQVDTNHFINFWDGAASDGFVQVFTVNTSTWAVTTAAASLEFDTQLAQYNSCYRIDTNHFINFWNGTDVQDGYVQVFTVEGAPVATFFPKIRIIM